MTTTPKKERFRRLLDHMVKNFPLLTREEHQNYIDWYLREKAKRGVDPVPSPGQGKPPYVRWRRVIQISLRNRHNKPKG